MKVDVTKDRVAIVECHQVTEGEYCVNECEFTLPSCFDGLTVTAVFNNIPVPLFNNRCYIPSLKKGGVALGVYAYRKNGEALELVYSPKPTGFFVDEGSYTEETQTQDIPEISRYEEYCKMLADFCENIIIQMDYVKRDELVKEISSENSHLQVPSAKAVYDLVESTETKLQNQKSGSTNIFSNALKGSCVAGNVVMDDVSPLTHDVECKITRKNLMTETDIGEFTQRKNISFEKACPAGVYSISAMIEADDSSVEKYLVWFTQDGGPTRGATFVRNFDGRSVVENISLPQEFDGIAFFAGPNASAAAGKTARLYDIQIEKSNVATEYSPYFEYENTKFVLGGKNLSSVQNVQCENYEKINLGYTLPQGKYSFGSKVSSNDKDSLKCMVALINEENGAVEEVGKIFFQRNSKTRVLVENQEIEKPFNCLVFYCSETEEFSQGDSASFTDFQIEFGEKASNYKVYKSVETLVPDSSGEIKGIKSKSPEMSILSFEKGALVNVEYNRDIAHVIKNIEEKLFNEESV